MRSSNKRVRFAKYSEMVFAVDLSRSPFRDAIWFTAAELDAFESNHKRHARTIRFRVMHGNVPAAEEVLGVEKFLTEKLTNEYKVRRAVLFQAVTEEDRRQRRRQRRAGRRASLSKLEGEALPEGSAERLAEIARERTRWARERARAAALFLAQDAEADVRREALRRKGQQQQQRQRHQRGEGLSSSSHSLESLLDTEDPPSETPSPPPAPLSSTPPSHACWLAEIAGPNYVSRSDFKEAPETTLADNNRGEIDLLKRSERLYNRRRSTVYNTRPDGVRAGRRGGMIACG